MKNLSQISVSTIEIRDPLSTYKEFFVVVRLELKNQKKQLLLSKTIINKNHAKLIKKYKKNFKDKYGRNKKMNNFYYIIIKHLKIGKQYLKKWFIEMENK